MLRWLRNRLEQHRNRYGRLAAFALGGSLLLALFDWWQRLDFAWRNRGGIARVLAAIVSFLINPWFYWLLAFLAAALLIWVHFSGQKQIAALEAALEEKQTGAVVHPPTVTQSLDTYRATADYREGQWWLLLERRRQDSAGFRVFVTDPVGATTRKVFGQGGNMIIVRYPEDFEPPGLGGTKQPWGEYRVRWEIHLLTEDRRSAKLDGTAETGFDWQPFSASM